MPITTLFRRSKSMSRRRPRGPSRGDGHSRRAKALTPGRGGLESLESRQMMAADPILFDANDVGWAAYYNQTSSEFSQTFNQLRSTSLPTDIEVASENGQARIGSTWITNTGGRAWALWRDLSSATFTQKWNEYKNAGYRLVDQEAYTLGTTQYYAGIWIKNTENLGWLSYRDMTAAQYQNLYTQHQSTYLPVDVDMYSSGGQLRYSAVFVQNTSKLGWIARSGLDASQFSSLFTAMSGSYRVTDIESYTENGQQRYAVVWVRNANGRGWASRRDLSEVQFWNEFNSYLDQGYRLVDYERYQVGSSWRYAAVWRQNGGRLNWSLKGQVDQVVSSTVNTFKVPGMSVVVLKDGQSLYQRGFGSQDVGDGLWYSSRTINRLASVSKAVAGVLSMDLVERGLLNIDRTTRSYVTTYNGQAMPTLHTHTLRQLLSNRAGIGHYDELGTPSGTYSTALAASARIWNNRLYYTPGRGYLYSTHGYTLLGAAIEGALKQPIKQVVQNYLTTPYGLGTLKVEDRSVSNRYRSSVYNTSNQEVAADDISWKILGGGLESSTLDLANFGQKVLSGAILTAASKNAMWTAPAPTSEPYGLGWDLGSTGGTRYVAKSGGQLGANTYLLMFPERGIVVAVMSNRQYGGHSASTVAWQVGNLALTKA